MGEKRERELEYMDTIPHPHLYHLVSVASDITSATASFTSWLMTTPLPLARPENPPKEEPAFPMPTM